MPPDRPLTPTSLPHLDIMVTDDGSRTLRDRTLDETFHSGCGALSECWYVYLLNSGVHAILLQQRPSPVRVLELGFGTGMGWLITAAMAQSLGSPLQFTSLESHLLPADVLAQIDTAAAVERGIASGWLPGELVCMRSIEQSWIECRRSINDRRTIEHQVSAGNCLQVVQQDVRDWLSSTECEPFDAIYFDAFSPATNPELWEEKIFASIRRLLGSEGTLVSYCVSGAVRRALQHAGFAVERRPGPPGGKREVLLARIKS